MAQKTTDIDKFLYLSSLRKNSVHLFYRLLIDHVEVSTILRSYDPCERHNCIAWVLMTVFLTFRRS